jgi:nicotinamidase-related amidase
MKHALILIDYQRGFDEPRWGQRNHPQAEQQALRLLAHARSQHWQVVVVRHDSTEPQSTLRPGQIGHALKPGFEPLPGEWLVPKQVHSSFIGTGLEDRLRQAGITALTIAGITTDQCVSTTTRMANNLGFSVTLVEDACACFALTAPDGRTVSAEALHQAHIATLGADFAKVTTTAELLGQQN